MVFSINNYCFLTARIKIISYESRLCKLCTGKMICKGKTIYGHRGHRVARRRGSHIFSRQSAHRWRRVFQPYAPAALYPQEDPWYIFLLEADST
jgi:hypothetical protein